MTEAAIVAWLKHPGESFVRGEPLVEIETDKATVVYEAEEDGVLAEILVSEESPTAALGAPITPDWTARTGERSSTRRSAVDRATVPGTLPPGLLRDLRSSRLGHAVSKPRQRATPVAERTATSSRGDPLQDLVGTGPGGRVANWTAFFAPAHRPRHGQRRRPEGQHDRRSPLDHGGDDRPPRPTDPGPRSRPSTSRWTSTCRRSSAFAASVVDLVEDRPVPQRFRRQGNRACPSRSPAFNSSFVDGRSEHHSRVNVGIAVATEDALLVPTVLDADQKALSVIAEESRDLAARARARKLLPTRSRLPRSRCRTSGCSTYGRSAP